MRCGDACEAPKYGINICLTSSPFHDVILSSFLASRRMPRTSPSCVSKGAFRPDLAISATRPTRSRHGNTCAKMIARLTQHPDDMREQPTFRLFSRSWYKPSAGLVSGIWSTLDTSTGSARCSRYGHSLARANTPSRVVVEVAAGCSSMRRNSSRSGHARPICSRSALLIAMGQVKRQSMTRRVV